MTASSEASAVSRISTIFTIGPKVSLGLTSIDASRRQSRPDQPLESGVSGPEIGRASHEPHDLMQ